MYAGTPRILFYLNSLENNPDLEQINGCHLTYSLESFVELRETMNLFRENELLGLYDVVPGIKRKILSETKQEVDLMPFKVSPNVITCWDPPDLQEFVQVSVGDFRINITPSFENDFLSSLDINRRIELSKHNIYDIGIYFLCRSQNK
jgi:hypothetical protein